MNIPKFIKISINSYLRMTFSLAAKYQIEVSYAKKFLQKCHVCYRYYNCVRKSTFLLFKNKINGTWLHFTMSRFRHLMHVHFPNHTVCLNDVHFIDSIVTFVVYYAKVIVVKSLCLDYVDVREAKSCGSMSETCFQYDKGNVLKRLNSDENMDDMNAMSGPR